MRQLRPSVRLNRGERWCAGSGEPGEQPLKGVGMVDRGTSLSIEYLLTIELKSLGRELAVRSTLGEADELQ